jgi:predicted nucleic acid-binding protein
LHEVIPDACFLIDLRDSKNLDLLLKVSDSLSWRIVTCEAALYEASIRMPIGLEVRALVTKKLVSVCSVDSVKVGELRILHSYLGSGELECLAHAIDCKTKGIDCAVVSDDQPARRAFESYQISHFGTFDFLEKAVELKHMLPDDAKSLATELSEHKWLKKGVLEKFHRRMDSKKKS